jgi:hypothetical protein
MNTVLVRRGFDHGNGQHVAACTVWCPGCDAAHAFNISSTTNIDVPIWQWDGNEEKPTFSPSYMVVWKGYEDGSAVTKVCHSFLRNGVWEFLTDCTHELAGQHVPMVPLPDWLVEE